MNQSKFISKNNWISFFVDHFNKEIKNSNIINLEFENLYSLVDIPIINDGHLICYSKSVLKTIFNIEQIDQKQIEDFICGKINPLPKKNYAMVYSGHQFGVWAGQLGDGRVINFGEISNLNQLWTIQLKGIGLTPYSRFADGNAVLRSTIREHIASEALYNLNIPTTRSLGVVKRKYKVKRDIQYNGMVQEESGSINCRVAQNFIRIGNFQHVAQKQDFEGIKKLLNYLIDNYYVNIKNQQNKFIICFEEIVKQSAQLVAQWQSIGFVHGVLNTDNHSVQGLTIDYGPYGFMEKFDQQYTANKIGDQQNRYCYENQPKIILWNLYQLANSLMPILQDKQQIQNILDNYQNIYDYHIKNIFTKKLGFQYLSSEDFNLLYKCTISLLQTEEFDFTLFFSELGRSVTLQKDGQSLVFYEEFIQKISYKDAIDEQKLFEFDQIYQQLLDKYDINEQQRKDIMNKINPVYIIRNWFLQEVIDQVDQDNYQMLSDIEEMIENPYIKNNKFDYYYQKTPQKYIKKIKYDYLSCSSQLIKNRQLLIILNNKKFIEFINIFQQYMNQELLKSQKQIQSDIKIEKPDIVSINNYNTLNESVMISIIRDLKQISQRIRYVIIPFGRGKKQLKNWDMWGPLLLCISFSWTLSIHENHTISNIIFGTVFCLIWIGSAVIALNAKLLKNQVSFFHCVCTLGYGLFPLNVSALIAVLLKKELHLSTIFIIIGISFFWSCKSASIYIEPLTKPQTKLLTLYPIFLFYLFLSFFIVQMTQDVQLINMN